MLSTFSFWLSSNLSKEKSPTAEIIGIYFIGTNVTGSKKENKKLHTVRFEPKTKANLRVISLTYFLQLSELLYVLHAYAAYAVLNLKWCIGLHIFDKAPI